MHDMLHLFNIKTEDASRIYDALTTAEGLASWWTTAVEASPEEGSVAEFRFLPDYTKKMKVTKLEKNKTVHWECIGGDSEWIGTQLEFHIEPADSGKNLRFYHRGWAGQTDMFGNCNYHWGLYLKSLKTFIETGTGYPHDP